jgi:hypothetical protein
MNVCFCWQPWDVSAVNRATSTTWKRFVHVSICVNHVYRGGIVNHPLLESKIQKVLVKAQVDYI